MNRQALRAGIDRGRRIADCNADNDAAADAGGKARVRAVYVLADISTSEPVDCSSKY